MPIRHLQLVGLGGAGAILALETLKWILNRFAPDTSIVKDTSSIDEVVLVAGPRSMELADKRPEEERDWRRYIITGAGIASLDLTLFDANAQEAFNVIRALDQFITELRREAKEYLQKAESALAQGDRDKAREYRESYKAKKALAEMLNSAFFGKVQKYYLLEGASGFGGDSERAYREFSKRKNVIREVLCSPALQNMKAQRVTVLIFLSMDGGSGNGLYRLIVEDGLIEECGLSSDRILTVTVIPDLPTLRDARRRKTVLHRYETYRKLLEEKRLRGVVVFDNDMLKYLSLLHEGVVDAVWERVEPLAARVFMRSLRPSAGELERLIFEVLTHADITADFGLHKANYIIPEYLAPFIGAALSSDVGIEVYKAGQAYTDPMDILNALTDKGENPAFIVPTLATTVLPDKGKIDSVAAKLAGVALQGLSVPFTFKTARSLGEKRIGLARFVWLSDLVGSGVSLVHQKISEEVARRIFGESPEKGFGEFGQLSAEMPPISNSEHDYALWIYAAFNEVPQVAWKVEEVTQGSKQGGR